MVIVPKARGLLRPMPPDRYPLFAEALLRLSLRIFFPKDRVFRLVVAKICFALETAAPSPPAAPSFLRLFSSPFAWISSGCDAITLSPFFSPHRFSPFLTQGTSGCELSFLLAGTSFPFYPSLVRFPLELLDRRAPSCDALYDPPTHILVLFEIGIAKPPSPFLSAFLYSEPLLISASRMLASPSFPIRLNPPTPKNYFARLDCYYPQDH